MLSVLMQILIPMRGNEFSDECHYVGITGQILIPMRGNEGPSGCLWARD